MAQTPSYYVNSPAQNTQYNAPAGYWFIPSGGGWTATVKAWSGANGTGSLVAVTTLTAYARDITTGTNQNSFTGSGANTTNAAGNSTTDTCAAGGSFAGSGVGSLELYAVYTGSAVVPGSVTFTPSQGLYGSSVTITGTNFNGATAVTFNGAAASFTVNSNTQITATVPSGSSPGTITVTNPSGSGTSAGTFSPYPQPAITSFTPTAGAVGTSITLTGSGFTRATGVAFNGTAATTFSVVSDTTITATVPTGATTGNLSVSNPVATGTSSTAFTVSQAYADNATSFVQGATIYADNGSSFVTGTTVWSDNGTAWVQIG